MNLRAMKMYRAFRGKPYHYTAAFAHGLVIDKMWDECARCHGEGGWYYQYGPDDNWDSETCPDCSGTGVVPVNDR